MQKCTIIYYHKMCNIYKCANNRKKNKCTTTKNRRNQQSTIIHIDWNHTKNSVGVFELKLVAREIARVEGGLGAQVAAGHRRRHHRNGPVLLRLRLLTTRHRWLRWHGGQVAHVAVGRALERLRVLVLGRWRTQHRQIGPVDARSRCICGGCIGAGRFQLRSLGGAVDAGCRTESRCGHPGTVDSWGRGGVGSSLRYIIEKSFKKFKLCQMQVF